MKAGDIAGLVKGVTKRYSKQRKAEKRNANARARRSQAMRRSRFVNQTEASEEVIEAAYMKASTGNTLPAKARQVFYAARKRMLQLTGRSKLDSKYFTKTLLPKFINSQPALTASWKVIYDARGCFEEPHTDRSVPLGTLEVDKYLRAARDLKAEAYEQAPEIKLLYPTAGFVNRMSGILFIEKQGFDELFDAVGLAAKYDIGIMSSKGQSVVASRRLVDEMCNSHTDIPVIILHDFDKHGVEIGKALTEVTSAAEEAGRVRYRFRNNVKFVDAGLWLPDVEKWDLEPEPCPFKGDFDWDTRASEEDQEFLRSGQRVELNAFSSGDLIKWIESILVANGIEKVIPDDDTLETAYRHTYQVTLINNQLEDLAKEAMEDAKLAEMPADLRVDVEQRLKDKPTLSWDAALASIAEDAIDDEENNLG